MNAIDFAEVIRLENRFMDVQLSKTEHVTGSFYRDSS